MPTQNQIEQAQYQAWKSKQTGGDMPPLVAGQPVASAEEGKQVADISGLTVPSAGGVIQGMVTPYNVITTGAEAAGTAIGGPQAGITAGRLIQPVATAAQRYSEGKPILSTDTLTDTAWNAAVNEVGRKVGDYVGKGMSYVGQSAPVQAVRSAIAKRVIGKFTPSAKVAYDFTGEMIDDVANAVNNVRQSQGKPLYSRDEVEKRLAPHIENLRSRGVFTIPDLTSGGLVDAMEPLAEGSIAGKGTFSSKRSDQDALLTEWPKVWAGMLGDEAAGPDTLAATSTMAIEGALRNRELTAGGIMGQVQDQVGKKVVPIDETFIAPLEKQVSNYVKRYQKADGAGQIKIDPEGLDQHIKNAIGFVERATGKKFNLQTGAFETNLPKGLAGQPPQVIAAMQKQGLLPASNKIDFTFDDVQTMRGNLDRMAANSKGDKKQADAALTSLSEGLRAKMNEILDAEDAAAGRTGAPDSLRNTWKQATDDYGRTQKLREGFQTQAWVESLKAAGNGREVIPQIWPDGADANRIIALKDLLGGEGSPYWDTMKRFKMEDMVDRMTRGSEPADKLYQHLTDYKVHSKEYWDEVLGSDQYNRILKFASVLKESGKKNPFGGEAGLSRRIDAGFAMRVADPSIGRSLVTTAATTGGAGLALGAAGAAAAGAGIGGYMISARKVAQWLTNPEDSAMFLHIARGAPLKMKEKLWLRNQVGRAIADATKDEQPDIMPIPRSATREELKARSLSQQKPAYGGQ